MPLRFALFDCMETLIQMDIASVEVYPDWAYLGARDCGLWEDAIDFRTSWDGARRAFVQEHGGLREGTIAGRLRAMVGDRLPGSGDDPRSEQVARIVDSIHRVFWEHYLRASFVEDDVRPTLEWLRDERGLGLGVVSNFMVPGGIEELLQRHGLRDFFAPVIVSCDLGWKKPAEPIYEAAIERTSVERSEILFIGDNPLCDYDGPRLVGMRPRLYDPSDLHPDCPDRIRRFSDLRNVGI